MIFLFACHLSLSQKKVSKNFLTILDMVLARVYHNLKYLCQSYCMALLVFLFYSFFKNNPKLIITSRAIDFLLILQVTYWLNSDFLYAILVQRSILAPSTAFYLWRHSLSKTVQSRMKVAFLWEGQQILLALFSLCAK